MYISDICKSGFVCIRYIIRSIITVVLPVPADAWTIICSDALQCSTKYCAELNKGQSSANTSSTKEDSLPSIITTSSSTVVTYASNKNAFANGLKVSFIVLISVSSFENHKTLIPLDNQYLILSSYSANV